MVQNLFKYKWLKYMGKINVFLRTGKNPHPIYYDLIDYPPKNILFKHPKIIKASAQKKPSLVHKLKVKLWCRYIKNNPPAILLNKEGCDLIHSTNNLMVRNKSPWVMDIELLWGIINFKPVNLKKSYFKKVKKILSSKYCKTLMPYTNAAKQSLINGGMENLEYKMEILYPAKKAIELLTKQDNEITRVLWAGSKFYEKGGNNVLQVFNKIEGKHKFKLIMLGPVPEEVKEKYSGKDNIEFVENKRHAKVLWEEFSKADIFFYPTNLDSFGLGMLDAMNYSIPILCANTFSSSEIVEDGVNGFIVEHPFKWHDERFQIKYDTFEEYMKELKDFHNEKLVSDLSKKLIELLNNKELRIKMGLAGRKMIEEGKFSINERNKKLEKIYLQAIKNDYKIY